MAIEIKAHDDDVKHYLSKRLEKEGITGDLEQKITEAILKQAQGMSESYDSLIADHVGFYWQGSNAIMLSVHEDHIIDVRH